jgi:Domain of unknown function (DUF309)
MSDDCNRSPFWQRQPRLPLDIQRFFQDRMEAALHDPESRQILVWPTILGAPGLRQAHPGGIPEAELLVPASRMLSALGHHNATAAWKAHLARWPDTAVGGPDGWRPAPAWGGWGPLVSLRCGWQLAALTPLPLGERYPLACGVSLFNHGLYHECHDALEPLWAAAGGELKNTLQGLILLAGGYHHLQQHNLGGMLTLWEEALLRLGNNQSRIATPWGEVRIESALDLTARRLDHGRHMNGGVDFTALWIMDRPTWELA